MSNLFFKIGSWALVATAGIHSLSFLSDPVPASESERQLIDLLNNYQMDMGAGFHRTMGNFVMFFSMSMSILTLAIGVLNLILVRHFTDTAMARKLITFNAVLWTLYLVPLCLLTFLPPIVCYSVAAVSFVVAWGRTR